MALPKPVDIPTWATTATGIAASTQPAAGQQGDGWVVGQKPPANYWNWIWNRMGQWCAWLNDLTNQALTWVGAQTFNSATILSGMGPADQALALATWQSATVVNDSNVMGLAYRPATTTVPGLMVAVGNVVNLNGGISTSPDGMTWTQRVSGIAAGAGQLQFAAWGNGLFIVGGGNNLLLTSPDGITWTSRTSGFGGTDTVYNAVWNAALSLWVICGGPNAVGRIATSPDGITWTLRTTAEVFPFQLLTIGPGNIFIAASCQVFSSSVWTSPDGITWTQRAFGGTTSVTAIAANSALIVVTDASSTIFTSPDGITWTARTPPLPLGAANTKALWNGRFFALLSGSGPTSIASSIDGITWTRRSGQSMGLATTFSNNGRNTSGSGAFIFADGAVALKIWMTPFLY